MDCKVKFVPSNIEISVPDTYKIMDAERAAGLGMEYPCGGNSKCGKCFVDIELCGDKAHVKACDEFVKDGMIITIPNIDKEKTNVLTSSCIASVCKFDPLCKDGYGVAFDIGTTTIAAYLIDLKTGGVINQIGELNEQVRFGGDVVSRCIYAKENGVDDIADVVNKQADKIIGQFGVDACEIKAITIVGNTAMQHIFARISPTSLVEIPYMPAKYGCFKMPAKEFFSNVNPSADVYFIPVIAGYVGADTVGAMLATRFNEKENITLLLDIGTNGEIALGNKDKYFVCSTASGPAFEGAKIVKGMRGAPGAIDHVWLDDGDLAFSTIGDIDAIGICGSGLIDFCARLLDAGVLMKSGRFDKKYDGPIKNRFIEIDGTRAISLSENVYVTQKDIREVQLAKGAISAGIKILMDKRGASFEDVTEVLIAGAFGNYMDPLNACKIGLIPIEFKDKITPVGNAAGEGAKMCLISCDEYKLCDEIASKAKFLELASVEDFQDRFIKELDF